MNLKKIFFGHVPLPLRIYNLLLSYIRISLSACVIIIIHVLKINPNPQLLLTGSMIKGRAVSFVGKYFIINVHCYEFLQDLTQTG